MIVMLRSRRSSLCIFLFHSTRDMCLCESDVLHQNVLEPKFCASIRIQKKAQPWENTKNEQGCSFAEPGQDIG
ncbi:hypothetical protein J3E72DRAFT_287879 [Bipolaris maydis]|nr:hypothetical protein J3E73DRAFT_266245 [Bipolaris maydis]KAJ6201531.1 hypothetical protein J3E72DRAFT_287879 [Bipolaris maydis]KAJ6285047.1 hypothetical protein J3E71DRAFT_269405 [Bipolaris maydis]